MARPERVCIPFGWKKGAAMANVSGSNAAAIIGSILGALSLSVISVEIISVHVNVHIGLNQPVITRATVASPSGPRFDANQSLRSSSTNSDDDSYDCENSCKCRSEFRGKNRDGIPEYYTIPISCK